jgi:hypothetical protein
VVKLQLFICPIRLYVIREGAPCSPDYVPAPAIDRCTGADVEENMYTAGMDPKKGPVMLSHRQVAQHKAVAAAQRELARQQAPRKAPPRSQTPVDGSSDDDDPNGADTIWSQSKHYYRRNKNKPIPETTAPVSVPMNAPEPVRQPTPMTSPVNSDDEGMSEDQRRKANLGKKMAQRGAPKPKPVPEAKASKPVKGQESPETKVSKPTETRRQAPSRAGSLRSGGGSGQTGTCVAKGNPPKT